MSVPLITPVHHWYCPACGLTSITHESRAHSRFHSCPRLGNLSTPMVPAGTRAKVTAVEREDYISGERVRFDANGRPIQSVVTERDDGQDVTVYAPTARVDGSTEP